tara:strand:+ start:3644 stop:4057 length:414 start_codon:yes stop_codon:yes gene_type:complete
MGLDMEKTLIIFKPDCVEQKRVGHVLSRFEENGFTILDCKVMLLTEELLSDHYSHIRHLPFFPEITGFMSSKPVIVMVLEGKNVVQRVRELLGPTDSTVAPKGSIRGDFGTDRMRNIAHASDSWENAKIEIKRFFGN